MAGLLNPSCGASQHADCMSYSIHVRNEERVGVDPRILIFVILTVFFYTV